MTEKPLICEKCINFIIPYFDYPCRECGKLHKGKTNKFKDRDEDETIR